MVTNQDEAPDAHAAAEPARNEWVVQVEGVVRDRPDGTANAELATGAIEVAVDRFTVLNPSKVPPFYINEEQPGLDESLRLAYRYLDLRRPRSSTDALRARLAGADRRALEDDGFVEIETPTLIRCTPEGARDFVVPPRCEPAILRAAPVARSAQAAADGRRLRPLLPAGPRLAGRGPARRSAAGAHPGRHRDELRPEEDVIDRSSAMVTRVSPAKSFRSGLMGSLSRASTYDDAMDHSARTSPTCASAWSSST